jgi:hypothetical protein
MDYIGGFERCGAGSEFHYTLDMADYSDVSEIVWKLNVWAIDSWEGDEYAMIKAFD